jgi:hypothetical protein
MRCTLFASLALVSLLAGCDGPRGPERELFDARPEDFAVGVIVNFADYRSIKRGMTLEEVESRLGATGYRARGFKSVYLWKNPSGSGMACYFVNGRLANKASIQNLR